MDLFDFAEHSTIKSIVKDYSKTKEEKKVVAYNLFTLSSYNAYLENFHSDVIASLLNPKGLHHEGDKFLQLFIAYLNEKRNSTIIPHEFKNAEVHREIGNSESHIDIAIIDSSFKKAIIIENKINDAVDMDKQIDRYYHIFTDDWKYEVCGIVYLTLDGVKQAPPVNEKAEKLVMSIGAFTDFSNDLVNGWLIPCFEASENTDNKSLVNQYIKLIKHLANKNMDTKTLEKFYQFISQNDGIETAQSITELLNRMPDYRADKFTESIKDYSPFLKSCFWGNRRYRIYEGYKEADNIFKLDIEFYQDGSVSVRFWNPSKQNEHGLESIRNKCNSIGMYSEFEISDNNFMLVKSFSTAKDFKSLTEVDEALSRFVNLFMEKLRTSVAQ